MCDTFANFPKQQLQSLRQQGIVLPKPVLTNKARVFVLLNAHFGSLIQLTGGRTTLVSRIIMYVYQPLLFSSFSSNQLCMLTSSSTPSFPSPEICTQSCTQQTQQIYSKHQREALKASKTFEQPLAQDYGQLILRIVESIALLEK
jgi:hypothetical protein